MIPTSVSLTAVLFGVRVAAIMLSMGVAVAFSKTAWKFVMGSEHDGHRLGMGLFLIAVGTTVANAVQIVGLVYGDAVASLIFRGQPMMIFGLSTTMVGYFLNFTAWGAAVTARPQRPVAALCLVVLVLAQVAGMVWFTWR